MAEAIGATAFLGLLVLFPIAALLMWLRWDRIGIALMCLWLACFPIMIFALAQTDW